jgi:hypothetical protein
VKDLVMLYQGTNRNFATQVEAFYSVVALATSSDSGVTWTRKGVAISGSDPKPTNPKPGANGADQSGAIIANGYVYDFYPNFPNRANEELTIQAARAPVASDGAQIVDEILQRIVRFATWAGWFGFTNHSQHQRVQTPSATLAHL